MYGEGREECKVKENTYGNKYTERMDYSWSDFFEDVGKIGIGFDDKGMDCVVAIARGGISLGVVLAHEFRVPLFTIRVKSYIDKRKSNLFIGEIPVELRGKRVIVVDDIIDSKETIAGVCDRLKSFGVNVISKVVLCKREGVQEECIFGREVKKGVWVDFAWEV